MGTHHESVVAQFTRQATHFSQMPGHNHEESLRLLISMTGVSHEDTVLDVACGSGIVARAFAPFASQVTGIDITPAMLDEARRLSRERGLTNLSWQQGDIEMLPFADDSFSILVSRYAFHHLLNPQRVISEMVRVCRPGGQILIADAVLPGDRIDAYNQFEKLLDPSHSRALTFEELDQLLSRARIENLRFAFYRMEMEMEQQLATSFPTAGDDDKIRKLLGEDVGLDRLGVSAHWRGDELHYAYPVTVVVGEKTLSAIRLQKMEVHDSGT